ncbi:LysE family translocator [Vibrio rumoiensis]|uniref:LysE family translocator n=1 Tax=Vibrio rumoiensis TaxID=76258 RepID=UPI003AA7DE55
MNITSSHLFSFLMLAVVMSATPGPNNLMVLSSAIRYGTKQTLGHVSGASAGSALMLLIVGLGLHQVFMSSHYIQEYMKYLGSAYIIYLAWNILRDSSQLQPESASKPMSFLGAVVFQWINPKSWVMASVAISTCLPSMFTSLDVSLYAIIFTLVSFPCVGVWAVFGSVIKRYLTNNTLIKTFNMVCAGMLFMSAVSMVII